MFSWLTPDSQPMSDQTLVLILVFVFAVLALLALGARSFTRLVELILSHISRAGLQQPEDPPAPTSSSPDLEHSTALPHLEDTPTTPVPPPSPLTDDTTETK